MSSNYVWSSYGQIDSEKFHENTDTFESYSNNLEILYNGAGYKTYYEYAYLCCNLNENN